MKLLVFPRYDSTQASTRVRVLQYLPFLKAEGIEVEVFHVLDSKGISGKSSVLVMLASRFKSYYRVASRLLKCSGEKTVISIHSELFPFIPFNIEYGYLRLLGIRNYVMELDDAWFHRYDCHPNRIVRYLLASKIRKLMQKSILVIAGNKYIADNAKAAGSPRVEIIPTVVDTGRYRDFLLTFPDLQEKSGRKEFLASHLPYPGKPVIGWIGSPATTKFLLLISDSIKHIHERKIANFVAYGADYKQLKDLPVKIVSWSEDTELSVLYQFDVGIMPLVDSEFERGKCGYKLIQYMACGLPVVASPVGVNREIVADGKSGYLAGNDEEWTTFLIRLCLDRNLRIELGKEGLSRAEMYYSLKVNSPKLAAVLKEVLLKTWNVEER